MAALWPLRLLCDSFPTCASICVSFSRSAGSTTVHVLPTNFSSLPLGVLLTQGGESRRGTRAMMVSLVDSMRDSRPMGTRVMLSDRYLHGVREEGGGVRQEGAVISRVHAAMNVER